MSEESSSIFVESSWEAGNQKSVNNAVTLTPLSAYKRNEDGALTDMVELASCILLSRPAEENGNHDVEAQPCTVSLKLKPCSPFLMRSIVVVSEARMIEVYGAFNEYLMTVSAKLLDQVDDTAVYCAEIDFSQLTQECTLKFARLTNSSEMWLYGIKVLWDIQSDAKVKKRQNCGVDFETVDQRLKESERQLSGRAKNCKQFLKMFSSQHNGEKQLQGFPDAMALLSLLPAMSQRTASLIKSSSSSQTVEIENKTENPITVASRKNLCKESESSVCSGCCQQVESILEKKLVSMENRIMEALDEKIAALKTHQDRQMESLFNLFENTVSAGGKLNAKTNSRTVLETPLGEDAKIELAINNLLGGNIYSHKESVYRSISEGSADILRNALMSMKLDKVFAGSSQNDIDGVATVLQNSS